MSSGFAKQRGRVFCFGPEKDEDSGTLFKVGNATEEELKLLDQCSTTNLGEERSVGLVNYEISIRGKNCLESISRNTVLN